MDADDAVEQAEAIIELIDEEVPEWAKDKAPDFFEDVRRKVAEVSETIERTGRVTAAQQSALEGWEAGVRKWIKD